MRRAARRPRRAPRGGSTTPRRGERGQRRERGVLAHRQAHQQALVVAVGREVGDAGARARRPGRRAISAVPPARPRRWRARVRRARAGTRSGRCPRCRRGRRSRPRRTSSVDVARSRRRTSPETDERRRSPSAAAALAGTRGDRRPTISRSISSSESSSIAPLAAHLAVAHDGHAVGDLADLGQAVGDVDDGRAARRPPRAPARRRARPCRRPSGAVGSSRIRICGSSASAFASSTSCRWATLSSAMRALERPPRSRRGRAARASRRGRPPAVGAAPRGAASAMFSATVRSGSSAGCWWTIARPVRLGDGRRSGARTTRRRARSCPRPGRSRRTRRPSASTCRRRSRRAARGPRRPHA